MRYECAVYLEEIPQQTVILKRWSHFLLTSSFCLALIPE